MGHSKTQGRRRLTLPLPLRAKMTGLAMFVCGFMGLITSAQLDPISAHVERVIDGDTIHVSLVARIGMETEFSLSPSGSVRRCVRTQAVRARSLCSGLFGRVGPP